MSRVGAFQNHSFLHRITSSILFRAGTAMRKPVNWLLDQANQGAELLVLARSC